MNKYKITIINEAKFWWWNTKVNWGNQLFAFLTIAFWLSLMIFGKSKVDNQITEFYSPEGLLIGFLTLTFMFQSFFMSEDIGKGLYEQLDLSCFGINRILIIRAFYNTFFSCIKVFLIIIIFNNIFDLRIKLNFVYSFTLLFIGVLPLYLIGIILNYLIILLQDRKIIAQFLGLIQVALPATLLLKAYPFSIYSIIPYISSATTVKLSVTENLIFESWWYLFILVQSIVYTISFYSIAIFVQQKYKRR